MPRQNHCNLSDELVELIAEQGMDGLPELIRIIINAAMKAERQAVLRAAPSLADAQALLARTVAKYAPIASKLSAWMETNLPEGLTVMAFPMAHRQRLRTVNALERLNQELRRRTKVVRVFPNEAACLRLVSALAMETSDEWETGKT